MSGGWGSFCPLRKLGAPGEGRPLPFYSSSRLYSGSRGLTGLRSPNSHPVREAIQASWRGQQHRLQKGNGTLCQGSLNGCERVCVCQREIERENMCEAVSPETKKQEVTCEPWKGKGSAPRSGMRLAGCGGCLCGSHLPSDVSCSLMKQGRWTAFLTAQGYGTGTCTLIKESSLGDRELDGIRSPVCPWHGVK